MKNNKQNNLKWLKVILICFFILLAVILYSRYIGTKDIKLKEINIINSELPQSFYGYKIIHISDIHYNTTISNQDLKDAIKKINKSKPNIVVITGDVFDKETKYTEKDINNLITTMNKIDAEYKYIITGDHDDNEYFKTFIEKTKFNLLDNNYEIIFNGDYDSILIGGISTRNDKTDTYEKIKSIESAIQKNKPTYNILLMHEPSLIEDIDKNRYQLVLAGHTHLGQINIPLINNLLAPKKDNKYIKSYYKLDNTDLYISPGIGTSNIKARLLNKPTINLYRLLNK